jgi:uncharacterized protein YggE
MVEATGSAETPYVEVLGTGSADAVSNVLRVNVAAESRGTSVAETFDGANAALARIAAALRQSGTSDEDLKTSEISLNPDYDRNGRPTGYRATMGLEVVLRDITAAGATLAAAVEAGGDASRINGVSLAATAGEDTLAAAREAAWADATARAEQYAARAGRSLGAVLRVSEGRHGGPPVPRPAVFALAAAKAHIEPGVTSITASVSVRWALV